MADKTTVALIDDDDAVLDSLQLYLRRRGLTATCFPSAPDFLAALDAGSDFDCVVCDVKMTRMTGLQLQRILTERGGLLPLILITGHGDIDMAVSAIKAGASDFIEKPIDNRRLADGIVEAVGRKRDTLADEREAAALGKRYAELSERQQQVMSLATQGFSNKEIAAQLGISPRTVEHYRESAMERMQAGSLAELVHMAVRLKVHTGPRKDNTA
ncbi:MAG: response regulator transcription factor [Hyphomicrobiaceae bacterium]